MRTPPATFTKTSACPSGDARVAREHGDDHREPLRIDAGCDATRHCELALRDEGLDLEQDRPRPLERAGDGGSRLARHRPAEDLRRIRDAGQPGAGHLEHAELVRRAEAVLHGTQHAVRVVAVALELQHAVDEMLEHARPGDRAVLRHVADEDRRDVVLLRDAQQPRRGLAHLRRPSRAPNRRSAAWSVCTESTTQTSGRSVRSVSQTVSSSVSARIWTFPAPPSRSARSFTWATDSSPVTSREERVSPIARNAIRSSVDLPTPGSKTGAGAKSG